jgi:hypothetical protein
MRKIQDVRFSFEEREEAKVIKNFIKAGRFFVNHQ